MLSGDLVQSAVYHVQMVAGLVDIISVITADAFITVIALIKRFAVFTVIVSAVPVGG